MKNSLSRASGDQNHLCSVNPSTGELLEEFELQSEQATEASIERASIAALVWRDSHLTNRANCLVELAKILRHDRGRLARSISLEMGKPITEAEAEVDKCAWNCGYVAEMGEGWLRDEPVTSGAAESYISYLPMGVLLAIMPWNFPLWQVVRFAASALMAGNAILLKHAPNVTRCAINIEDAMLQAGFPHGLFQSLIVPVERVPSIIADQRVAAVTLTGSPRAGAAVAALAGAALKKSVLELGGSDAFIVLADADVDAAVKAGIRGRFSNCGQICLAPKRFLLEESIAEEFEHMYVAAVTRLRIGDPLLSSTELGPMARADLRDELDRQVQDSVACGARVVAGAAPIRGTGNYYLPSVLTDVTPAMRVMREETFGPVAALMRVRDADEALSLANDSEFGLSSNLWTRDAILARDFARRLQVGGVFINGVSVSDPRLPIGGVKRSGFGRELACVGIREFVNVQTVWIGATSEPAAKISSD